MKKQRGADTNASFLAALEKFADEEKFIGKGPLALALVVNNHAQKFGLPLDPSRLVNSQKGQVLGLGKASVQAILKRHGIDRVLAEEGGRTSRGSMLKMRSYVEFLNEQLQVHGFLDLVNAEQFWIDRVRRFFAAKPFVLKLDAALGVRAALRQLLTQALKRQRDGSGTMFVGTLMQHLVGAKLAVVLKTVNVVHHSANANDHDASRHGDFDVEDFAIHVTTAPSEALVRKCADNLGRAKRPIIVTTAKGMLIAEGLLENAHLADRVDLIEFEQFIATNVLEMTGFRFDARRETFETIVGVYNTIVDQHESDPSLRIVLGG